MSFLHKCSFFINSSVFVNQSTEHDFSSKCICFVYSEAVLSSVVHATLLQWRVHLAVEEEDGGQSGLKETNIPLHKITRFRNIFGSLTHG